VRLRGTSRSWRGNLLARGIGFLIPFDLGRHMLQSMQQNLIHIIDGNDFKPLFDIVWNIRQIFLIFQWNQYLRDTSAQRGKKLFFQPTNRQDPATQSDLTGHRNLLANRDSRHHRDDRCGHGRTG